ncbi:MAG: biopolymer transporter ExbD [Planctomycetota bacterium]|nr:MAG: biopolymer transporter ExbD [Planctomycetota bacterium]
MARRLLPASARIEANLTPMIDVSFLLIVFFVLVSRISGGERTPMELPDVRAGAAEEGREEARVVLSVLPGENGKARAYRLDLDEFPADPDGLVMLTEALSALYRSNPTLAVNLRADRTTQYEWISPCFRAATVAASLAAEAPNAPPEGIVPRMNLVVTTDTMQSGGGS